MEPAQGKSTTRDYEVFLSFRGPDTRLTITDSLFAAMVRAGIRVFKDDEELRVGEEIGGELLRAISNSKIYVPIFSKDYASSKWCLRELAYMVECRKRGEKAILPIFYEVDASDVKLKTGSYAKALQKHERESGEDVAKRWEEALREVAGIKGWNLKDHGQDKLTALVVEEVFRKLRRPTQRDWRDNLVGAQDQMEAVMELLSQGTPDVRFVVIHGMGGIGKTTLAKAIFRRISSQFQCSSFLSDIRADNIVSLQKKLLCDFFDIRRLDTMDADEGVDLIKGVLSDKKVILVLDDMDKRDQLMKLAGKSSWFGSGSRIIITTRNTYFLAPETDTLDHGIVPLGHGDFHFYEMKEMQFGHALQLFSKHSFERDSPPHDYTTISSKIVRMTGGLPLALEVIGSLLHSKSMETWKDTLKKLKKVPNQDVQQKLLISYEELDYDQQQIFLDIACHCIGEERVPAYYMWKACEFFPKTGLSVLIHLSLIKVIKDDRLRMHDQLRDLGREIVRRECFSSPGKRSRLWCPTVALDVVRNNLGTDNIVALKLIGLADEHNFTSGEFSRLSSLRFLELDGGNFVGDFKNLLSNLKWLSWRRCPSNLQATGLCLRKLAVLKISESDITEDWNGWGSCMVNDNLKVIYLTSCYYIKRTPDFSKCMNLKKLVLKGCTRLEEINSSICQLGCLKHLEISKEGRVSSKYVKAYMEPFFTVPLLLDSIGGLKSLSVLKAENLHGVIELPHSVGELQGLKHLSLRGCTELEKLPSSIGELRSLLCLDLSHTFIRELPDSIGRLESLLKLDLSGTLVAELPNSIGNLRRLESMCLDETKIRKLPKSIWALENLEELSARGCRNLEGKIPSEISGLSRLKILNLSRSKVSELPMAINQLSSLQELILKDCRGLETLPDLPTSLTKLELSSSSLQAVPDLSNLTNLHHLDISDCAFDYKLDERTKGCIPNPNLEWLGRLHKLQTLRLVFSQCNFPPTDLSSFSQLRSLKITCPDPRSLIRLPSSLEVLSLEDVNTPIEWPMFPNLGNLSELKLTGCRLREIEFGNVPGQLGNLQRLQVRKCESLVRLSNLSSLKELRVLSVEYCPQLIEIESQPSSSSTGDCSSTERPTPGTLKLEKLHTLRVYFCFWVRKLPDIPNSCHVEVCPGKHVRRSGSGPVFLEDYSREV
ncbi:disease resistance protein RPV1-like [Rhodamnia argentea]|uniref:Disease resistance protein RPV1-like n=1 Tax=Rhodamnia argentea TaxID=178133 RepID=A0ABM3HBN7_9MYRT|nr:disease resistance protein RPV1-like [Rhodamnia argentea]